MSAALAVIAIGLCGAGLVAAGFPERAESVAARALRVAFAVALGLGTWSAAWAASLLVFGQGDGLRVAKDVLLAAGGAILVWLRRGRPLSTSAPADPPPKWLVPLFVVACLLCAGVMVEHTLHWPDGGYDAWMIWNLRVRFLVRASDFRTAFSPDLLYWAHQDYPWLLPGAVAQAAVDIGRETPLVAEAISFGYGMFAVAVVSLSLWQIRGTRWGLLGGLTLVTTPCFALFIANQQSDVPTGVYLAIAAALTAFAIEDPRRPASLYALSGFAAGMAAWTKNEGLLYAICLAAGLLWAVRRIRPLVAYALGFAPAGALLAGFKLTLAPPNDLMQFTTHAGLMERALDLHRWGELALLVLRRIVYFQDFALWVVAELLLIGLVLRRRRPGALGAALLLAVAAYAPIYALQPHPLDWLFRTSVDRIFIHIWPAAIIASLAAVARVPVPSQS